MNHLVKEAIKILYIIISIKIMVSCKPGCGICSTTYSRKSYQALKRRQETVNDIQAGQDWTGLQLG
jgi:hypothetical protein